MKKQKLFVSISLVAVLSLMALFAVLKVEAIQDFFGFGSDADIPDIVPSDNNLPLVCFINNVING